MWKKIIVGVALTAALFAAAVWIARGNTEKELAAVVNAGEPNAATVAERTVTEEPGEGRAEPGQGEAAVSKDAPAQRQTGGEDSAAPEKSEAESERNTNDWPVFLGPTRDNKSSETGILSPWPEQGPPVLWHREIGISYGIGSVRDDRLYQFDRYEDQARLTCMDARTGRDLWKFEYPTDYEDLYQYNGGPRCSPVIDGDRIYLFGVEGMLHCVSTDGGKLLWKVDTAKKFGVVQNFFGVGSTPVVEGDLLIVMIGGSPPESQHLGGSQLDQVVGNGSGVVAFDKMTGKIKYRITDELASYASLQLATINGRRWCFAFCRGGLVGFEPSSGQVDFQFPWRARLLESVNASTPVVVGDEVLISETYGPGSALLKVKPGGYDIVWRDDPDRREKSLQTHWNTPIHHEGYVYGCSGRHTGDAELRCVEWATGKVMWSVPRLSRSSLLYVDGHFVCQTEYGDLILLKANPRKFEPVSIARLTDEDGRPLLKYPCWAAPILVNGRMYVRGDGRLICLKIMDEQE